MFKVSTLTSSLGKQSFTTGLGTTTLGTAAPVRDQPPRRTNHHTVISQSVLGTSEVGHSASLKVLSAQGRPP